MLIWWKKADYAKSDMLTFTHITQSAPQVSTLTSHTNTLDGNTSNFMTNNFFVAIGPKSSPLNASRFNYNCVCVWLIFSHIYFSVSAILCKLQWSVHHLQQSLWFAFKCFLFSKLNNIYIVIYLFNLYNLYINAIHISYVLKSINCR